MVWLAGKSRLRSLLASAFAGWIVVTASGCGPRTEASTTREARTAALAASTVAPIRRDLSVTIDQPGQIEAFEQTPIHAKIGGYVAEVCVDMDARVRKGDCLARLAVPEMDDELRQKQAAVAQSRAEFEQAKRTLQTAEASMRAASAQLAEAQSAHQRALANQERFDSEYERFKHLVERGVLDRQALDEARNAAKSAVAAREEASAKIRTAEASRDESTARRDKVLADIEVARTRLVVAQAAEQHMQTLLQYAVVQAPFTGVVTRRHVHTGHLLKAGDSGSREPLFVVARTDPVRIFVDVPEAEAQRVCAGVPARVRIQALNDREIEAKVTRVSWALDPGNRTLRAEIELPNATGELRPGMYAYAALFVLHPQTWTVPAALVQRSDDSAFCYVLHNGTASRLAVRVGARVGSMIEVLKKRPAGEARWQEITGEEAVLQGNTSTLTEGTLVKIGSKKE
jgi:RND family efflux transporter MFP subunit